MKIKGNPVAASECGLQAVTGDKIGPHVSDVRLLRNAPAELPGTAEITLGA